MQKVTHTSDLATSGALPSVRISVGKTRTPARLLVGLVILSMMVCGSPAQVGLGIIVMIINLVTLKLPTRGRFTFSTNGLHIVNKKTKAEETVPWERLRLVGLYRSRWHNFRWTDSETVVFNFTNIPDVCVNLSRISLMQRQQLFRILNRCAPERTLSPEVMYIQIQNLYGVPLSIVGFTKIWSDEFDRRFELANHVALPAGQSCGGGRYTIEMTIATRMSSSTYLVSDQRDRRFVLKELVFPLSVDAEAKQQLLARFNREASLLAGLSHKSIVTVRDHFVENDRSYLVMDFIPGENLRHFVRLHGTMPQDLVVLIARQLAQVLVYMHEQEPPLIHRDLTPDNVVYCDKTGEVTVIDFGAANIYHSHGTGTLIGKQGYMPPEQFKGKTTPASDVFALGSTLLFLLSGTDPPGMGRMVEGLNLDEDFLALLQSCLEFEQQSRPSAESLVDLCDCLIEGRGS